MLRALSIRDVVLIGHLELTFHAGLCVLTGETGAGKSILLDALGLALGQRADVRLVRHGAEQASVTAEFDLAGDHPARSLLRRHGLEDEGEVLLLRRVLGADGRSRAFVNDQAISVALLRAVGDSLVEVHGQFESRMLLDAAHHRGLLDAYGRLGPLGEALRAAWDGWRRAREARAEAAGELEAARREEGDLRHAFEELRALDPKAGEEEVLAEKRALLMLGEKLVEALNEAVGELAGEAGVEARLRRALRHLERVADKAGGRLDAIIAALDRAAVEVAEGLALLDAAGAGADVGPDGLERVEERLFALRAVARKHRTDVDGLPAVAEDLARRLAAMEDGEDALARLEQEEAAARDAYVAAANRLTEARRRAAEGLDRAVAAQLEPLKLAKARFLTRIEPLDEDRWGPHGTDRIAFEVVTNPGTPPGPLARISSGGERARFMLALRAVLAEADPVPTIVFDEVDSGVGGAVAAAVGERLALLAERFQVLVVTHSPQVAARGVHHWRVSKAEVGTGVFTTVDPLAQAQRVDEIARMLAGEIVTDEARAAADSLLQGAHP